MTLRQGWFRRVALLAILVVGLLLGGLIESPGPAQAAPGLCVGPVCGDEFRRGVSYPWQLRMRVQDQRGHRERIVLDCRDGSISPLLGPVERGYVGALGRRACRQAPLDSAVGGASQTPRPDG